MRLVDLVTNGLKTPEGMRWLEDFKRQQLGETKFAGLMLRKQTGKRDDKLMALVTKKAAWTTSSMNNQVIVIDSCFMSGPNRFI